MLRESGLSRRYRLGGLLVSAPFTFPGVPADDRPEREVDVAIGLGRLPGDLVGADAAGPYQRVGREGLLITVPRVARYLIRQGREILIEPYAGADEQDLRLFLSGSVFWGLCHQRGLLPLHASAIQVGSRCVAFAGPSGAGKSTLAAFLVQRGYPLMSDDGCVIACAHGSVSAYCGFPRLKLWLDSLKALRQYREDLARCRSQLDKYYLPVEPGLAQEPLPLWRVYVLQEAGIGTETIIERLKGLGAVTALAEHTQQPVLVGLLGLAAQHFKICAEIADRAEVYRVTRPLGFEHMNPVVTSLEAHWWPAQ